MGQGPKPVALPLFSRSVLTWETKSSNLSSGDKALNTRLSQMATQTNRFFDTHQSILLSGSEPNTRITYLDRRNPDRILPFDVTVVWLESVWGPDIVLVTADLIVEVEISNIWAETDERMLRKGHLLVQNCYGISFTICTWLNGSSIKVLSCSLLIESNRGVPVYFLGRQTSQLLP